MSMDIRRNCNRSSRGWIVAPTFDLAMEEWRIAEAILPELIIPERTSRHEKRMFLWDGSEIEFKSADNKDTTLRGAGLDWAIITEAARVSREAWEQGIRPALSDRVGRAIFGSTPKGRNWFYELYLRGLDESQNEYKSWRLPSIARPSFPDEEWKTLKRTLPELVFKQEFEAEFLEQSSAVFRNLSSCISGSLEEPVTGRRYVMGVDLARIHDFTVLIVFDTLKKHLVYFDRFNTMSWPSQKEKIQFVSKKYNNCPAWIDSTGLGDVVENDLRRAGMHTYGYKFTQQSKEELIELAMLATEQKMITFPKIEVLINELLSMEADILPSGKISYNAPEGLYDDCVFAFCLALKGMQNQLYQALKEDKKLGYEELPLKDQAFWERWNGNLNQKPMKPSEVATMVMG